MILLSRIIAALAYAGAAFLFGVVLGERGELGFVQQVFVYAIPFATFILALVTRPGSRANVLLTGAAILAGVLLGQRQFAHAWDECVTRGYSVREALARYDAQHDGYPARLEELDIELPCRCGFRQTILRYLSNERGFKLWITNDREVVSFNAPSRTSVEKPGRVEHDTHVSRPARTGPSTHARDDRRISSSGKSSTPP